ncbi:GNAT family N-acetyltransferase [Candidatus Bathyarchaeota archaeon]|nr:GNAT family N-acetyltransferase [Candidatus Bathyarchaeota archaeon]MBS7628427.1 GNAT family N-acetyltransferase [Candidatus Bathyarchaeota archaeon]
MAELNIRTVKPEDFNFIIELAASEGVKYNVQDLVRVINYEPEGFFIAVEGESKLGVVSTVSYGVVGWLGNLFVKEQTRRRGVGTKLVRKALEYMACKGVRVTKLYCFPNNIPFYRRLGFRTELSYMVFRGEGRRMDSAAVEEMDESFLDKLSMFDRGIFGADRSKVLKAIYNQFKEYCFAAYVDGEVAGYIMAAGSEGQYEVGPWVCKPEWQERFAEELFKAEMNRLRGVEFEITSPQYSEVAERILLDYGLKPEGKVVRMSFGEDLNLGESGAILGVGSLDCG